MNVGRRSCRAFAARAGAWPEPLAGITVVPLCVNVHLGSITGAVDTSGIDRKPYSAVHPQRPLRHPAGTTPCGESFRRRRSAIIAAPWSEDTDLQRRC